MISGKTSEQATSVPLQRQESIMIMHMCSQPGGVALHPTPTCKPCKPGTSCLTSACFSSLICKIGIVIVSTYQDTVRVNTVLGMDLEHSIHRCWCRCGYLCLPRLFKNELIYLLSPRVHWGGDSYSEIWIFAKFLAFSNAIKAKQGRFAS